MACAAHTSLYAKVGCSKSLESLMRDSPDAKNLAIGFTELSDVHITDFPPPSYDESTERIGQPLIMVHYYQQNSKFRTKLEKVIYNEQLMKTNN